MCYSSQIWADYRKYVRAYGADIDVQEFYRLYWLRSQGSGAKIPKGMDFAFLAAAGGREAEVAERIAEWNTKVVIDSEQLLFDQAQRLAAAERKLAVKETKAALNDQRVAGNKIQQFKGWIADAKRTQPEPGKDDRIWPDWYCPLLVAEGDRLVVRPMRYHCRPAGKPASIDRTADGKVSGTYNARRDNLERFWQGQFGYTHGVMLAETFYENVRQEDGTNRVVQFTPRSGETMLVACLWSRWTGDGEELLSFAAITDEPEPEVAAMGHDRTIINLKPDYLECWLRPDPHKLTALYEMFDDRRHPFYEHRLAA
ncbi:SOS response-associated peptidase family protein [Pseudomonas chlororaphis]|uniref:SOS response-associated peptidase family protein n=1 Tax=Pseudomonas chlororaphis TaxID=587753 RepID=UPI00046F8B23|nr:SOS response-associated peptidase family protein [Pseudomonas chlororaphis]